MNSNDLQSMRKKQRLFNFFAYVIGCIVWFMGERISYIIGVIIADSAKITRDDGSIIIF